MALLCLLTGPLQFVAMVLLNQRDARRWCRVDPEGYRNLSAPVTGLPRRRDASPSPGGPRPDRAPAWVREDRRRRGIVGGMRRLAGDNNLPRSVSAWSGRPTITASRRITTLWWSLVASRSTVVWFGDDRRSRYVLIRRFAARRRDDPVEAGDEVDLVVVEAELGEPGRSGPARRRQIVRTVGAVARGRWREGPSGPPVPAPSGPGPFFEHLKIWPSVTAAVLQPRAGVTICRAPEARWTYTDPPPALRSAYDHSQIEPSVSRTTAATRAATWRTGRAATTWRWARRRPPRRRVRTRTSARPGRSGRRRSRARPRPGRRRRAASGRSARRGRSRTGRR